jgi:hypothetical protein
MPRNPRRPTRSLLAFALCLLVGMIPRPARAADVPRVKLIIQAAVFGDLVNDKTADVTRKVAGMVKDNNLWVKAAAGSFGDPAPGVAKSLRVGYTLDGVYHSKTVAEGEALDISTQLVVLKAVYGDLPAGPSADVTTEVAALIEKNSLSVKVDNETFGDPASGRVKKLRVDYTFDGKAKSKTIAENATLTISNQGE